MPRFPCLRLTLFLLLILSTPAAAQVIRGQIIAAEDNRPIASAFIILVDTMGVERAASLSDVAGYFRIQAPEPGDYRLRWELVGRAIDQSETLTLKGGTETSLRIVSFSQPLQLSTIEVKAASSCPANPDAAAVASLWVEVTKALRISQWTISDNRFVFDVETVRRNWDADFRRIESEERKIFEGLTRRPFATMPPDFLAEYGYVVISGGSHHYFAPDEKSLLHETFINQHCLSFAPTLPGGEALIGIAFEPAPERNRPDISGTFWLRRDSLVLSAIDYRFSGLDQFAMHPSLGGRTEYDRLPTGEWYISRWSIRTPLVSLCRGTGLFGFLAPRNRPCLQGIVETAGEVLDVRD